MSRVWPGAIVGDNALQVHVSAIRKALGTNRKLLKTVSGRGYQLLGDWRVVPASEGTDPTSSPPAYLGPSSAASHAIVRPDDARASSSGEPPLIFRADEYEIDLAQRDFRIDGTSIPLGGKAFDLLAALVEDANEIVTRDQLIQRAWPCATASKASVEFHISAIRKALGPHRTLIITVSGRSYRLLGRWTNATSSNPRPAVSTPNARGLTNLPASTGDLVGRDASIEYLGHACSAYRIVTLTGPGASARRCLQWSWRVDFFRRLMPAFGWWS